jgi:phage baseplate assembly protein W
MSKAISDKYGKSDRVSMRNLYKDFPMFFKDVHPTRKDISSIKDLEAVKHAVKNLVLTNFNERPFHPEIGSNVSALLFEPADNFTAMSIRDEIVYVLKNFEPRSTGHTVEVTNNSDRNAYEITIGFSVIFSPQRAEINFYLQRLR